jgi:two-component system nitrate/nitrite response regulator NarL
MSMHPIRLLVVDDHTLFRRGLVALLAEDGRFFVAGEAADAGEALRRAAEIQPDVILLDNHLPGVRGVDAVQTLKDVAPAARVLMLTVSEDEADLVHALRAGAQGYLLKTVDSDVLAQAIVQTMAGDSIVSPEMTGKLVAAFRSASSQPADAVREAVGATEPIDTLSPREREILVHISRGASNKEIARALDIAETTVKIHVQHILRKLNLSSRVQAAVYASGRGLP